MRAAGFQLLGRRGSVATRREATEASMPGPGHVQLSAAQPAFACRSSCGPWRRLCVAQSTNLSRQRADEPMAQDGAMQA